MITATQIKQAIWLQGWLYETEQLRKWKAAPVSHIPSLLREQGWKNVSHLSDAAELRKMGLTIVKARYIGGVKPKRFCDVVIGEPEKI